MGALDGRKIGFIGLGLMGKLMARNLHAAGASMIVTSRSPGPAEELAGEGMTAVATAREVVAASEITVLMVTDTSAVDAVLHGENGAIAGLSPDKTLIDMSTTKVRETRAWGAEVMALGAHYVDAPVSGGTVGAEADNHDRGAGDIPALRHAGSRGAGPEHQPYR